MIFKTISGSLYEIDQASKKIRRLSGFNQATARQGQDGDWKPYDRISQLEVGIPLFVVWEVTNGQGEVVLKSTATSVVAEIILSQSTAEAS